MAQKSTSSPEYRRRWGVAEKRIPLGHPLRAERRRRALDRITTKRRELVTARALKELGMVAYPKAVADIVRVDDLIEHKLGIPREQRTHARALVA